MNHAPTMVSGASTPSSAAGWCPAAEFFTDAAIDSLFVDPPDGGRSYLLWGGDQPTSAPITVETLRKAIDRVYTDQLRVHGSSKDPHVVHPDALAKDGFYYCGSCGTMIPVRAGQLDWDYGLERINRAEGR